MIVLCFSMQRKDIIEHTMCYIFAIVMCLHFRMQKEDILEHTNVTYHLCNIGIYLITLLNILMPRY